MRENVGIEGLIAGRERYRRMLGKEWKLRELKETEKERRENSGNCPIGERKLIAVEEREDEVREWVSPKEVVI